MLWTLFTKTDSLKIAAEIYYCLHWYTFRKVLLVSMNYPQLNLFLLLEVLDFSCILFLAASHWYHRMPSIIDDLPLSKCLVLSHGWSYLVWRKRTTWSNYSACVLSFTLAISVHNSERLADLAVVRCREMEGGEIFATKAAACFSPLHAICVLAKSVTGSSTNWHPLSPSHMAFFVPGVFTLQLSASTCPSMEAFPTSPRLGWAPCLCSTAGDCMPIKHHHIICSLAFSISTCLCCISYGHLQN